MSMTTDPRPPIAPAEPVAVQRRMRWKRQAHVLWGKRPEALRRFVWARALLAIVLAVILWAYVRNTYDPQEPKTLRGITVKIRNLPDGLIVTEPPEAITISYLGQRAVSDNITPGDFSLAIDLKNITPGSPTIPIQIETKPNVTNIELRPSSVNIVVQQRITRTIPVALNPINLPSVGYKEGAATLNPANVTISGPQGKVEKVQSALVDLGAISPQSDIDELVRPRLLDADNRDVADVKVDPAQVRVRIPISVQINYKSIPIELNITGVPAPGYSAVAVTTDMISQTINVYGDPAELEQVKSIVTEPIDISNATETVVKTVGLVRRNNLYIQDNRRINVTVTIAQAQTSAAVDVRVEAENLNPLYDVAFNPQTVRVTLSGAYQNMGTLPLVRAIVDLNGREPGTYSIVPQIRDNGNLATSTGQPVSVTITAKPTPTPLPTLTPLPIFVPPTATPTLPANTTAPASTTTAPATVRPTSTPPAATARTGANTPAPTVAANNNAARDATPQPTP